MREPGWRKTGTVDLPIVPIGETRATTADLWCLHIPGPDDLHPAPNNEAAVTAAAAYNAWVRSSIEERYAQLTEQERQASPCLEGLIARVIPWPGADDSHADGVLRWDLADWMPKYASRPRGQMQWVEYPDITDAPDELMTPAGLQLKQAQQDTLRVAGVIADKIEDGSLFRAGIYSNAELAEVIRKVRRAASTALARGQLQWVEYPDITDAPDELLTPAGKRIKQAQRGGGCESANCTNGAGVYQGVDNTPDNYGGTD